MDPSVTCQQKLKICMANVESATNASDIAPHTACPSMKKTTITATSMTKINVY